MSETHLRDPQRAVVVYESGKMGVSAVPGSGKTFTLSHLAAALVERLAASNLTDEQEVLIVTFTNAAVNTFRSRIAHLLQQERGLLPYVGYRVRTLHSLAHDIVRMRPGLVGLSEGFEIVDERVTTGIIRDLAAGWIRTHADNLIDYLDPAQVDNPNWVSRIIRRYGEDLVGGIAREIIKLAKDNRWTADLLRDALETSPVDLPLARMGIDLYEDYQRSLGYRGAVDFDDLVRLALQALELDPAFLERLRQQWPFILEDEAQDSSKLQNEMLRLLTAGRNWVRVGDPNQAIFTTFTTADSNFLRAFLREQDVADQPLPHSGRSAQAIIDLANALVVWASTSDLVPHLHHTFYQQIIEPTPPDDPQQNPPDGMIHIDWDPEKNITPELEIERVVGSLAKWLPDHKEWTVAVLAPENTRGFKVAEALEERGIPYEELLRSTSATRSAAAQLQTVIDLLADPTDRRALGRLYQDVWWRRHYDDRDDDAVAACAAVVRAFEKLTEVEDYIWPGLEHDWLDTLPIETDQALPLREDLTVFRAQVQRWLQASDLPIDQLILTISQDVFTDQADLALGHKIAVVLRSIASNYPDYRLPQLGQELRLIAQNQRRFLGFDDATTGYEPQPGVVTVATMHAAKGLEWDRVYLMAVNNYSFPAALPGDSYMDEKWFARDELNLKVEARRQVERLMEGRGADYVEGAATDEARVEYAAERLRLLYVGITRAKHDLIITWNMGRFWEQGRRNEPAAALIALHDIWERSRET